MEMLSVPSFLGAGDGGGGWGRDDTHFSCLLGP